MKHSSKFLERICKRVRRRTRSSNNKEKKQSDVCRSKLQNVGSPVDTSRSPSSVAISEEAAASWSLELARGAFQDSSVTTQTRPSPMEAAEGIPTGCSSSLPARMDSYAVVASSVPLLQVQSPVEEGETKYETSESISSRQASLLPNAKTGTDILQAKEMCMLSATDSGLYSEEDESSSEDEYLEVFSDDEEEEGLVDDGWLIPADEVSLDKVVTASNSETVYRLVCKQQARMHLKLLGRSCTG